MPPSARAQIRVSAGPLAFRPAPAPEGPETLRAADVISALSYALDLTEGQPMGHAVRGCLIGLRLADRLGLPEQVRADLYYALLLKDCGCSSNSARLAAILGGDEVRAKREVKLTDWTRASWETFRYLRRNAATGLPWPRRAWRMARIALRSRADSREVVQLRCERGAEIARRIGFSPAVSAAIRALDEHWDGHGQPLGLRRDQIPFLARVVNLCQTLEVFAAAEGPRRGLEVLRRRAGRWFDPELVAAARGLENDAELWRLVAGPEARARVLDLEPGVDLMAAERLDEVCAAFADVVDAKSPYTFRHSEGVTGYAQRIAKRLNLPARVQTLIRRAALLHDIGKLAVPNSILDKPGKLTGEEWEVMKRHPYFTEQILNRIGGFAELSFIAAAHHERLDGRGYFRGLNADQLPVAARVIAVADVFEALSARRPYREALPTERVLALMREDSPRALDPACLEALSSQL